jgi:hypothetical protein
MQPAPPTQTLYQRAFGPSFQELHPVLRDFHGNPNGGNGQGPFDVIAGDRWYHKVIARIMGFPPPGTDIPLTLKVTTFPDGSEQWTRHFRDLVMHTRQYIKRGQLHERAGAVCMALTPASENQGMTLTSHRVWFLGIPLPRFLSPHVHAVVVPQSDGWRVQVTITLPFIGQLLSYQGTITMTT